MAGRPPGPSSTPWRGRSKSSSGSADTRRTSSLHSSSGPDRHVGPVSRRTTTSRSSSITSTTSPTLPGSRRSRRPVTTHMFRHTFAVIAADEPFAEIAVGWQLKHAANRILTTQAHLDREGTGWDTDIATEQTRSAIDALYQSFSGYLDGGTIAGGEAPDGRRSSPASPPRSRSGSPARPATTRSSSRSSAPPRRTSTPAHSTTAAFDASLALCLTSVDPSDRSAPVLSACQPGRCPNATIEEKHGPVWVAALDDSPTSWHARTCPNRSGHCSTPSLPRSTAPFRRSRSSSRDDD